jgi:hypothetical protein
LVGYWAGPVAARSAGSLAASFLDSADGHFVGDWVVMMVAHWAKQTIQLASETGQQVASEKVVKLES